VIHDPTRKAIASIRPNVLTVKLPMLKSSGYIAPPTRQPTESPLVRQALAALDANP
jgi:hypothetical protein